MQKGVTNNEPIEMERKFLVDIVDDLPECRELEIFQTYILNPDGGESRLRKRIENGECVYFLTTKKPLSPGRRIEWEHRISESEYVTKMALANPEKQTIHKIRRCFPWDGRYLELDTFIEPALPHCLLEIEDVELDEPVSFPPCLQLIREVSVDPDFFNSNIAKRPS